MPCRLCTERGRPANFGSDPQCGFDESGNFTTENWMCATLLKLRELAGECGPEDYEPESKYGGRWRAGDSSFSVVEALHPRYDTPAWIVLSWYKDRGQTGQAWFFYTTDPPRPITIADAERALGISQTITVYANVPTHLLSP